MMPTFVGTSSAEPVFKADVTFSFFHFAIAVRTKVLLFTVDLPGVVVPFKPCAAYIATTRFKQFSQKYQHDNPYDPFHL